MLFDCLCRRLLFVCMVFACLLLPFDGVCFCLLVLGCFLLVCFASFWHGGCLFVCLCLVWCVLVLLLGFAMAYASLFLRAFDMGLLTLFLDLIWCLLVLLLRVGMVVAYFRAWCWCGVCLFCCPVLVWRLLSFVSDLGMVFDFFLLATPYHPQANKEGNTRPNPRKRASDQHT